MRDDTHLSLGSVRICVSVDAQVIPQFDIVRIVYEERTTPFHAAEKLNQASSLLDNVSENDFGHCSGLVSAALLRILTLLDLEVPRLEIGSPQNAGRKSFVQIRLNTIGRH